MAKPKHGRWNTSLSSDHRRCPSPAVLSALAIIATVPSAVAASPLPLSTPPPTFLCPFIERDNIAPSSAAPSTSTPAPSSHLGIADRYVQGTDYLWRKADAWTLYGSTCCSSSTTASTSTTPISSPTPMPTSTSSTATFDPSALPAGWDATTTSSSSTESSTILALAIVLAVSICVFIIGCLVWRRRKKRARDIERKFGKKHSANATSHDNEQERGAQGKMRMWVRATARWKSNIRQSARRRRKKPSGSSLINRPTSPAEMSIVALSTPSRRCSYTAERPDSLSPSRSDALTGPPDPPCDTPRPPSPPTYGASFSSIVPNPCSTPPPDRPQSAQRSDRSSFMDDEPLPYVPPSGMHLATDDKAQLARMRALASSPPTMPSEVRPRTQSISVPEWHEVDYDLENLDVDLSEVSMSFHNLGLPPSFPPPPSKADVPFGHLSNHYPCYGEGENNLASSIPGPSGSSFGASASAHYPGLEPSAPSLEGGDDLFQDWDGASSYVPEDSTSVDQESASTRETESSIQPAVPSTSRPSFPPRSAARDSILPQYHP